ncbi:hypothetical protein Barb6XT_01338 [Bacteroidales bacterium Barb6XT]|nr:hypothetical protein Barb6XT_01338 [Bacteroidales bacterium Barb6XT]
MLNGEESAGNSDVHTFTLQNTRTGVSLSYLYQGTDFSYDEQGVVTFVSFDFHEAKEIETGLYDAGFQYEYRKAYTSPEGVKYPYQLTCENPQPDTELWVDNKLVPAPAPAPVPVPVPVLSVSVVQVTASAVTIKNTRTGASLSFRVINPGFSYNSLGDVSSINVSFETTADEHRALGELLTGISDVWSPPAQSYTELSGEIQFAWKNHPDVEVWVDGKLVALSDNAPVWTYHYIEFSTTRGRNAISANAFHYRNEQGDLLVDRLVSDQDLYNMDVESLQSLGVLFETPPADEGPFFRRIIIKTPQPGLEFKFR